MRDITTEDVTEYSRRWKIVPWVASLGVIGFWLVFGNRYSLWLDEAFSVDVARRSVTDLLRELVRGEGNMGPYYIVLWLWEKAFPSAWGLRALSMAGTVVAIWGLWILVRRRGDTFVSSTAVIVFTVNPFVLSWAIQARGYSWVMALSVWSLVKADDVARTRSRRHAIHLGVLIGLSVAISLTSMFFFAGVAVALVCTRSLRQSWSTLGLALGAALLTFAPFAIAILSNWGRLTWVNPLTIRNFLVNSVNLAGGLPTFFLFTVGVGAVIVGTIKKRIGIEYSLPLLFAGTGALGVLLVSLMIQPMYLGRYLAAASPMIVISVVGGFAVLVPKARNVGLSLLVVVAFGFSLVWSVFGLEEKEDYRWATQVIESDYEAGDGIVGAQRFVRISLEMNWEDIPSEIDFLVVGDDGGLSYDRGGETRVEPPRLWVIMREYEDDLGPRNRDVLDHLRERYPLTLLEERRGPVWLWLLSRSS